MPYRAGAGEAGKSYMLVPARTGMRCRMEAVAIRASGSGLVWCLQAAAAWPARISGGHIGH